MTKTTLLTLVVSFSLSFPALASAAGANHGFRCGKKERDRGDPECSGAKGGSSAPASSVGGAAPAGGLTAMPGGTSAPPPPTGGQAQAFQNNTPPPAKGDLGGAAEQMKNLTSLTAGLAGPVNADGTCPPNTEPKKDASGKVTCVPKMTGATSPGATSPK